MVGKWLWRGAIAVACIIVSLSGLVDVRASEEANLERGGKIFASRCVACHGEEGRGDGPIGKTLGNVVPNFTGPGFFDAHPDAELKKTIREGHAPMPAFQGTLTARDIDDVIAYLKHWAAHDQR